MFRWRLGPIILLNAKIRSWYAARCKGVCLGWWLGWSFSQEHNLEGAWGWVMIFTVHQSVASVVRPKETNFFECLRGKGRSNRGFCFFTGEAWTAGLAACAYMLEVSGSCLWHSMVKGSVQGKYSCAGVMGMNALSSRELCYQYCQGISKSHHSPLLECWARQQTQGLALGCIQVA